MKKIEHSEKELSDGLKIRVVMKEDRTLGQTKIIYPI